MLDFRIYTFLAVCNCMNYTKAAEQLHITQPAVTQHIHYLENMYQTKLFLHEGKKIRLSPAGKLLLHTATALKNDETFLMEQMQHIDSFSLPFHFGVTMTIGEFIIANPLISYQKHHPETKINIHFANTCDLLSQLRSGEINFALVEGYFPDHEFSSLPFSMEDFIPVCAAAHEFKQKPRLLSDLLTERLIIREPGSGTRNILEKNLDSKNMNIQDFSSISEIGNIHTIIEFIKADCGISFLYKIAVKKELESGVLTELQLEDFHMKHNFTFIWNKESIFTSQYNKICNELLSFYHDLPSQTAEQP